MFQYPAMMVPELQKQVIIAILYAHPEVTTFADPFLGSGTILALAMLNGRAFVGQDINPLSILIAKARAFSLDDVSLTKALDRVKYAAAADHSRAYAVSFDRQQKWFTAQASVGLSRLRNAIRRESKLTTRRFLWVCLAETVRLNSNSRTSTYKLHVKPEEQRNATISDVFESFSLIASENIKVVKEFSSALHSAGHLDEKGNYNLPVLISYGDSAVRFPSKGRRTKAIAELVITSPPYGDNRTTVPYGQAAWLPLQWIDFEDIDRSISVDSIRTAYQIDNSSLGGVRARDLSKRRKIVAAQSVSAAAYATALAAISKDGLSRFVNFIYDFRRALRNVARSCTDTGHIVITLGDRNIGGIVCPLSRISSELFTTFDVQHVTEIERRIPSKRMPGKNSHSATITRENVSIFRKRKSTDS